MVFSPSSRSRPSAPSRSDASRSLDLLPSITSSFSFPNVTLGSGGRPADGRSLAPDGARAGAPAAFFARTVAPADAAPGAPVNGLQTDAGELVGAVDVAAFPRHARITSGTPTSSAAPRATVPATFRRRPDGSTTVAADSCTGAGVP